MVLRMAMSWSNSPDDQEEGARHGLENGHDLVEVPASVTLHVLEVLLGQVARQIHRAARDRPLN